MTNIISLEQTFEKQIGFQKKAFVNINRKHLVLVQDQQY